MQHSRAESFVVVEVSHKGRVNRPHRPILVEQCHRVPVGRVGGGGERMSVERRYILWNFVDVTTTDRKRRAVSSSLVDVIVVTPVRKQ